MIPKLENSASYLSILSFSLTVILSIVAAGVVGLLGFLAYDIISGNNTKKANADVIGEFDNSIKKDETTENTEENTEIPVLNVVEIDESKTVILHGANSNQQQKEKLSQMWSESIN